MNYDLQHHEDQLMRLSIWALKKVGMMPMKFETPWKHYAYHVYHYIVLFGFTGFVTTQYIELCLNVGADTGEVINNLCVSLLYSTTIVKTLTCISPNMQNLLRKIRITEIIVMDGDDDTLKDIHQKHVKLNYWLSFIIYSLCPTTVGCYYINPYVEYLAIKYSNTNDTFDYVLPLSSWIPFDTKKHYAVAYCWHIIAAMYGGSLTVITDAFLWGTIVYAICQIKMLHYKLKYFKEHAQIMQKKNNMDPDVAIKMSLFKCLILHRNILSFTKDLDKSMNMLMLLDFAICSLQMGACGMRVFLPGSLGFSIFSAIEFLFAMLVQMIIFYWHANEITLESSAIPLAIYESGWYTCDQKIKKSLLFMMMGSHKPMTLNIGPFYAMSTATAISIIKATYSYVTLMRQSVN